MEAKATAMQRTEEPTPIKTTKRESIFEQMNEAINAISRRAFELFEENGRTPGHELEDWFKAERELLHPVHIQMTESDGSFEVRAEVPGFNEKELQISVEPTRLTIVGKRESTKEEKKGKTVYSESCSNQIFRTMDLPAEVDADKATATLKNGMLSLTIPKAAKARTVRIQPKVA
jgi:HSP20 family protein